MSKLQEIAQAVENGKAKIVPGLVQEALDEGAYVLIVTSRDTDKGIVDALNQDRKDHFIGCFCGGACYCTELERELRALGTNNTVTDDSGNSYVVSRPGVLEGIDATANGRLVLRGFDPQNLLPSEYTALCNRDGEPFGRLLPKEYAMGTLLQANDFYGLAFLDRLRVMRHAMDVSIERGSLNLPNIERRMVFFRDGFYLAKSVYHQDVYANADRFIYHMLMQEQYKDEGRSTQKILDLMCGDDQVTTALVYELELVYVFGETRTPEHWRAILNYEIATGEALEQKEDE